MCNSFIVLVGTLARQTCGLISVTVCLVSAKMRGHTLLGNLNNMLVADLQIMQSDSGSQS